MKVIEGWNIQGFDGQSGVINEVDLLSRNQPNIKVVPDDDTDDYGIWVYPCVNTIAGENRQFIVEKI